MFFLPNVLSIHQVLWKSIQQFLPNPDDKQINNWSWLQMFRTGEVKGLCRYPHRGQSVFTVTTTVGSLFKLWTWSVLSEATRSVSSAHWLPEDGEGQEARGSSLRVCENIPAKSGWLNNWKLSQRPPHSLGLPHLFARVVTLNASSLCEAPRTLVHTEEGNVKKNPDSWRNSAAHNEAGVRAPCFRCLDSDCSSVLLPGADGLSGEQVVGYWGEKWPFNLLLNDQYVLQLTYIKMLYESLWSPRKHRNTSCFFPCCFFFLFLRLWIF